MRIRSIKISFDPKKLHRKLGKLIDTSVGEFARGVGKDTKENLNKGVDIYGRKFKNIQPVTREIRKLRGFSGSRPLIQSGDMRNSINVKKKSKMKYSLNAESYGNSSNKNVHQTGFTLANKKQQSIKVENKSFFFGRKTIPARPWFPTQDSVENYKGFEKIGKNYFKRFNKAFTKGRLKSFFGG